jgi:DNA replicative helicase MCM subunit Mcm2 (Cdc46/Mcm family)
MITGVGERQTYTVEATFECPHCHNTKEVKANDLHQIVAPFCMKDKCIYEIDETNKTTAYIQQLRIQEFLEDSRNSSPIEFDAEIVDENVGEAFIGDRKTLVAKFRSIAMEKGKYNQIVFQILEMNDLEQKAGCMPEPSEVEKWKQTPNFFDRVTASVLPNIMVNPKHIQTLILWACGGNTLNEEREDIHIGLLGDAQTAKSKMLLKMHQLLPGSGYTVGRNVSGVGLTIGMVKLYNGTSIPKGGFFPQHTGHPCIMDEVDKMDKVGHDSCLEVMEQGTTTMTKNGVPSLTLPSKCPLLIAGNPKNGKFNPKYASVMDNFDMEVPFVSRFDILWMMTDENNPETDAKIRKFIRSFKDRQSDYMTVEELQRYFVYIKSLDATINNEMMDKVDKLHAKMRPLNLGGALPIGWRQYHGLYRLLTASAKAHLRTEVTNEDFEIVEGIINDSYKTMKLDLETGKVEDTYTKKGDRKKIAVDETWSECMDKDLDNTIDKEEFLTKLSKKEGFNSLDVSMIFEKMIKDGTIELIDDLERYKKLR